MRYRIVLACLLMVFAGPAAAQSALTIDARTVIVESPNAPGPVKKAADDLASDMAKVFGARPQIVPASSGPAIEIASPAGGSSESFAIAARGNHVVLSGADVRGTIFAIYTFAQDYLGVDPMYYWNDSQPPKKTSITIPAGLSRNFPSPLFKYRGVFTNDEDQLTGWAPGEQSDHSGISRQVEDKIFETILRLKGNMIVPGTWTFSSDPQMKWAGERGLILNQHHAIPLGMNVARWPANV
ncbi:MAG TPA: glycosyl hydrolase 115 family protein, partial [Rhizomicrobium sp.]|nr:glycosyl hydrolase 115 family protein [Rhizomicrobium sp.]